MDNKYIVNIDNFYHSNIEKIAKEYYKNEMLLKSIFVIKEINLLEFFKNYNIQYITKFINKKKENIIDFYLIIDNTYIFFSINQNNLTMIYTKKILKNKVFMDLINKINQIIIDEKEYLKISSFIEYNSNIKSFDNYLEINKLKKEIQLEIYKKFLELNVKEIGENYLQSHENILILTGKPGVGKSKLIMSLLLSNLEKIYDCKIFYIKGNKALNLILNNPSLYNSRSPILLIVDDFDFEHFENIKDDLNHLLSLTDGIFNKNIKIMISTNSENINIFKYPALVRPGRLFDFLELKEFNINLIENKKLRKEILEEFKKDNITLAEYFYVLNRMNNKYVKKIKRKSVNIGFL